MVDTASGLQVWYEMVRPMDTVSGGMNRPPSCVFDDPDFCSLTKPTQ